MYIYRDMPISNHHKSFRDLGVIWKKLIWSLPGGILSGHRDMEVWEDFLRFSVTKGVGTIFNNYQFWRWVSWHFCSPKTIIFFRFTCHPGYQSPSGLWNIFSNLNLNPFATIASWAGRHQHILPIRFPSCFSFWAQTKNLPWKKTSRSTKTCHFLRGQKKNSGSSASPWLIPADSPSGAQAQFLPDTQLSAPGVADSRSFPPSLYMGKPTTKGWEKPAIFWGEKTCKIRCFYIFFWKGNWGSCPRFFSSVWSCAKVFMSQHPYTHFEANIFS